MEDRGVSRSEALGAWAYIAAHSFGGPAGQIAVMHRVIVDERRWLSEARFLHALNYCMLLPGPEAQQLATYLGWLMHGTRGGLMAGGLFILPGFVAILALSFLYAGFHEVPWVAAALFGVKAAVLAVVVEAVERIGKRVLKNGAMRAVAAGSFVAIFGFGVPFPAVVVAAGLVGWLGGRVAPATFVVIAPKEAAVGEPTAVLDVYLDAHPAALPTHGATARTIALWLSVWWAPVALLAVAFGPTDTLVQLGVFFSKTAMVTFGGAYAVLAYVAQEAVERFGWLSAGEMLDGLGMAETTPGPLIQVVQFVGFLAAWRHPGALDPWVAALLGSVVTTWVTFAPCFLWIFAGAPYVEWLRGSARLSAALSTITAAVVGAVLQLAVWLAVHVLFAEVVRWDGPLGLSVPAPVWATVDPAACAIAVVAMVAILRLHLGMLPVLAAAAVAGVAARAW
jgi:chromate transporter